MNEFALAKWLGIFWSGAHSFRAQDAGGWQVRSTTHDKGRLVLHPGDSDDDRFVLVSGRNGRYELCGWILGRDGKLAEYWDDPVGGRPAFFVPRNVLHALDAAKVPA